MGKLNIGELILQIGATIDGLKESENGLRKLATEVDKSVKSQEKMAKAADNTAKSIKKAEEPTSRFKHRMSEMSKTATIALGPLNGVASRITALSSIATSSALSLAILLGSLAGFTVLASRSIKAGALFESSLLQMQNAMQGFGNTTGMTASELNSLAVALAENTLTSTALARQAAIASQAFMGMGDSTERVLNLAMDLTQTFGGSLLDNTQKLGQVMENPIEGLARLTRMGIRYTKAEKQRMQVMVAAGKASEVSNEILKKLEDRVGGSAKKAAEGLAGAWDTLGERMTNFVETVGAVETEGGSLAKTISQISETIKGFTTQAGIAEKIGKQISNVFNLISNTALFLITNLGWLLSATIGYAVGGLVTKLVPAIIAARAWLLAQIAATEVLTIATLKATVASRAFATALMTTGIGVIIAILSTIIAKYTIFSDTVDTAAAAQERMNKKQKEHNRLLKENFFAIHTKAIQDQEEKIKGLNGRISELITHLEEVKKTFPDVAKVLEGPVAASVEDLKKQLAEANAELTKLQENKAFKTETEANNVKLMRDRYEELADSVFANRSAMQKYNEMLANADALQKHAAASGEKLTTEQIRYINYVKSLEGVSGLVDVKNNMEDLTIGLKNANRILEATRTGGQAAGEAVKKLIAKEQFAREELRNLAAAPLEEIAIKAKLLGINIAGVKDPAKAVAWAMADIKVRTKEATENTKKYTKEIKELTGLINAVDARKGISFISQIFDKKATDKLIAFRTKVLELRKTLGERLAEGGSDKIQSMIEQYQELADKINLKDAFKGIDTSDLDAVAKAMSLILQKQQEVIDGTVELSQVQIDVANDIKSATQSWSSAATDAVTEFVTTGKASFADFARSVINDLIKITIQRGIMDKVFGTSQTSGMGGSFFTSIANFISGGFAKGGAFNSSGITPFAKGGTFTNSIVSKPTMFASGGMLGQMGEAGPEAIVPLSRGKNGVLGINASGLGGNIYIQVSVDANGTESSGNDTDFTRVGNMIGNAVKGIIQQEKRPGGLLA